jgi:hypothetical protein
MTVSRVKKILNTHEAATHERLKQAWKIGVKSFILRDGAITIASLAQ